MPRQVFGFCCPCTGRAALVMELVKCPRGGSLDLARWALIRATDHSPETTRHRLSIASGVASGMAFLHDRGYIHADLKPGNVCSRCGAHIFVGLMFLPPIQLRKGIHGHLCLGGNFAKAA